MLYQDGRHSHKVVLSSKREEKLRIISKYPNLLHYLFEELNRHVTVSSVSNKEPAPNLGAILIRRYICDENPASEECSLTLSLSLLDLLNKYI